MKTKIFTYAMIPVIVILFWLLGSGVSEPIATKSKIEATEAAIIQKMKFIRELQIAYNSQFGEYCGKWDKLIDFAKNGDFIIVQKKELIKMNGGKEIVSFKFDTLGRVPVKDSLFKKYPNIKVDEIPAIPGSKDKRFSLFAGQLENGTALLNVFEVKDIYPINPARGAEFKENGEAYSVPTLIAHFEKKLKEKREEVTSIQKQMKGKSEADKKPLQAKVDELSKFVNLYDKKLERLREKPLRVGNREEATTAGNWE